MSDLKVPVNSQDHIRGDPHAPVTLVEYGDYECPHCGRGHPILKRVQEHFGKQLRFVYRHFPLIQIHPHAAAAAETAEFAGAHRRFWEMHDLLFRNQERLSLKLFLELVEALGLSADDLAVALETGRFGDKVQQDFMSGVQSGVTGTPTFFINRHRHYGSYEYEDLVEAIDRELALVPATH